MSCTHEQTANITARATATAGASHADVSAGITYSDWLGKGEATATARVKTGPVVHIGYGSCSVKGEAEVVGNPGDGLYHLHGGPYVTASAEMVGDVEVLAGPLSLYSGATTGRATATAVAGVVWEACPCPPIKGISYAGGSSKIGPYADIFAYADAAGDWRILVEAETSAEASLYGLISASWSVFTEDEPLAFATMTGGDMVAEGLMTATAETDESFASIFYSNGLLKLKGSAGIMQNLLPQYMADGEIIKRILEALGGEIERARYGSRGFPEGFTGIGGVVQQYNVMTATWGLDLWEAMLGLPVRTGNTDFNGRRGAILSQLAARKNESEYWFKRRLELILASPTNPNPSIIINPGEPAVQPYTIEIESNVALGEIPPTNEMTVTAHSSTGNLTGVYTYRATYVFLTGETDEGLSESPSLTIANGRIVVGNIPISATGAVARRLYRKNGPGNPWHRLVTIPDNTTAVYVDNTADASISGNPIISPHNTATTPLGLRFLDYVNKTKPAHLHVDVRSDRFRSSINVAGDRV